MDPAAIAMALIAAQAGQQQLTTATAMERINANAANSVAKMLDGAAQQSATSLANVASGVGANLNIAA
jgi:hypothetical protein